ncbi:hypothetical protein P4637_20540 [Halalkalibacterium halodurans]|jgi:hypothetical protein|uniref:BH1899 protein n=1 Tax=Halalkalibacterium halodurans (strain ATCC BAA-125 / DSM 18197 / FERM 7344 / JCM 9153 / C-125) TaxID=272558 RepID=Q9KBM7_HALH5|nr:hypothetical protein [Halalkalibacterium halodurans]MED3646935.1 hypothetical protein [Halalkalibacterium halodurans]MED4082662.1 hypothetical protein [Halalkalibacterium halodurans]MED4087203.1 hypothetical protein [Halalkalibacterium halodurans]MED4105954.1 hypothetical protein [Halalkalibacterium halodurans]MED4111028.1 hypothetical protein [Halalkalibacterium halodurans]
MSENERHQEENEQEGETFQEQATSVDPWNEIMFGGTMEEPAPQTEETPVQERSSEAEDEWDGFMFGRRSENIEQEAPIPDPWLGFLFGMPAVVEEEQEE